MGFRYWKVQQKAAKPGTVAKTKPIFVIANPVAHTMTTSVIIWASLTSDSSGAADRMAWIKVTPESTIQIARKMRGAKAGPTSPPNVGTSNASPNVMAKSAMPATSNTPETEMSSIRVTVLCRKRAPADPSQPEPEALLHQTGVFEQLAVQLERCPEERAELLGAHVTDQAVCTGHVFLETVGFNGLGASL